MLATWVIQTHSNPWFQPRQISRMFYESCWVRHIKPRGATLMSSRPEARHGTLARELLLIVVVAVDLGFSYAGPSPDAISPLDSITNPQSHSTPGRRPGVDSSWRSYACADRTTSVSTSYRSGASEQRAGVVDLGADELGRSVRCVGPVTEHQVRQTLCARPI